MTIEDGHFRTDGKTIEPCCKIMYEWIVFCDCDGWKKSDKCPNCGAKLECVKKLEVSQ